MSYFKFCNRCFQQEHKNSCIDLNLSSITISLETKAPLAVIYHILHNSNIDIINLTSNNLSSVNILNTEDATEILNASSASSETQSIDHESVVSEFEDSDDVYFKKLTEFKTKEEFSIHYGNKNFKANLYQDCQDILSQNVNLKYFLTCINQIYTCVYPNEHTKENLFVKLRKSLWKPESIEYKLSLDILKIPKIVKEKQLNDYQKQVEKNNTDKKIFSYRSLVKIIDSLKIGQTKEELFLFCLLTYGGRPADLFQNTIEPQNDTENNTEIIVSNIAKKHKDDIDVQCIRPLINCSSEEFIRIRNKMLYMYKDLKIYNEDNQINTNIMLLLNKCFQFYYPDETIKIIRKLYGSMAYREYGGKQNMNLFLKKVLGHKNVEVSFSYSQIELND